MDFSRYSGESVQKQSDRLAALRKRHEITRAIRGFFHTEGFIEVETPAMVVSPGLELHLDAFELKGVDRARFLNTSPEFHMKRLLVAGLPRIYQICKCFRREEQGALHEAEFTMVEWYRCFADWNDVMRDTEALVAAAARAANSGSTRIRGRSASIDLAPPWEKLTVAEAFRRYAAEDANELANDEERFYRVLVDEVEPQLGRHKPVFLTDYPARMASLARLNSQDPRVAERFEAYIDGIELCNGFSELTDPVEQRKRFEAVICERRKIRKDAYPLDERFVQALERGMPPCGGNALGLDRLIMLILGASRIDEVVAFVE